MSMIKLVTLLCFVCAHAFAEENHVHVHFNLFKNHLAITLENDPEWHTYWINPGDGGIKTSINLPAELLVSTPTPQKFIEQGNQWAYGYTGRYTYFYRIDYEKINGLKELEIRYLSCKNICIPGLIKGKLSILKNEIKFSGTQLLPPIDQNELNMAFSKISKKASSPLPIKWELVQSAEKNLTLTYRYTVGDTTKLSEKNFQNSNLIYPYPQSPFDFKHETIQFHGNEIKGSLDISWDGEYLTPPQPLSKNGSFKEPFLLKFLLIDPITKNSYEIENTFFKFKPLALDLKKKNHSATPLESVKEETTIFDFFYFLMMGFLGGIILNFMPCVLPMISLKLLEIVEFQKLSKKQIIRHNLFFSLGIISTFVLLSLIVASVKLLGTSIGWGFQLQSPSFVLMMSLVIFILGLNLLGLFEFATPGGKFLGAFSLPKNHWAQDFINGSITTVLSTPCSAPFLGSALTFAFSAPAIQIIFVFMAIGVGLSTPFLLTAMFPQLIKALPRPGNWMNHFKKLLSIGLFLTAFWLGDIYLTLQNTQLSSMNMITFYSLFLIIFIPLSIWKKNKIFMFASITVFILLLNLKPLAENKLEISANKWSEQSFEEMKLQHRRAFVYFTAKWCFTCKANERFVIETKEFKNYLKKNNIEILIGDWTKKDEAITKFLFAHNKVGVPAYFVLNEQGDLISLGETISLKKMSETFKIPIY